MATTIARIPVGYDEWVDVYTEMGVTVGDAITIQNRGNYGILLQEGPTQPSTDSVEGDLLTTVYYPANRADVYEGSDKIWARCPSEYRVSSISAQIV